jgi:hypothetical protein
MMARRDEDLGDARTHEAAADDRNGSRFTHRC